MRRAYVEMAKWKFDADVAERLARLVVECETGDELIAKAGGD